MLAEWKREIIQKHKGKKIAFVHIPKCAGTFVKRYCKDFGIEYLGHKKGGDANVFYFSVIRDPIQRFESFLNYRLWKGDVNSWPKRMHYIFGDENVDLNQIVSKLEDDDFQKFNPYKTLEYWTTHCHLLITIDELFDFLQECGFENIKENPKENVSTKKRGTLNQESIQKLEKIYQKDIELYKKWIR